MSNEEVAEKLAAWRRIADNDDGSDLIRMHRATLHSILDLATPATPRQRRHLVVGIDRWDETYARDLIGGLKAQMPGVSVSVLPDVTSIVTFTTDEDES